MAESYLTTDIIVIIVLVVVIVVIGICAFLVHFYWTKIGVAEIWNTAKWSSMRSSIYQTVGRFGRPKSFDEESLTRVSVDCGNALQKKKSTPTITSYHTPMNVTFANNNPRLNKPVSIMTYGEPAYQNYANKSGQSIDSRRGQSNNRYNDLASTIQKQRF